MHWQLVVQFSYHAMVPAFCGMRHQSLTTGPPYLRSVPTHYVSPGPIRVVQPTPLGKSAQSSIVFRCGHTYSIS